jgi:hypothetical protein
MGVGRLEYDIKLGWGINRLKNNLGEGWLPPFLFLYLGMKEMITKTELALKDLKKKHLVVLNHLNDLERELIHSYLPGSVKDPILEAYIALEETLEEQIQALEKIAMFQSINQGLGLSSEDNNFSVL